MKNTLILAALTLVLVSGCSKFASNQASDQASEQPQVVPEVPKADERLARDKVLPDHEAKPEELQPVEAKPAEPADDAKNDVPCLKATGPFCEVIQTDDGCDPKLIEHHYKVGDTLYWVNRTQYDTIECYYTEKEYNDSHDPEECAEIQDEGRGCVIDDSPDCNLMLDGDDCTVQYTRASCDDELLKLNKDVGDTVPGIWFAKDEKIMCFYTEKERNKYLKDHKLKCKQKMGDKGHICVTDAKYPASGE